MSNKLVKEPLSNIDLNNLLKDVNQEIGENKKINIYTVPQMMKNPKKFISDLSKNKYSVIFCENKGSQIGHWTVMYLRNNKVLFFCSYGTSPKDLDMNLYNFLKKHFKDVRYNAFQYQEYNNNVATCGRWCMLVVGLRKIYGDNLTLEKLYDLILHFKKKVGGSFDNIVAKLVNSQI
jgi:hypothetical protein